MDCIKNDIKITINDRKKFREVNESILLEELGKDDLDFIRNEVKRIEWRTEGAEECHCCYGCYHLGECVNSYHNYILDLEKMDLMLNTPLDYEGVYEYIDLTYDKCSMKDVLDTISLYLEYYEQ